jgi:hypothetical protein
MYGTSVVLGNSCPPDSSPVGPPTATETAECPVISRLALETEVARVQFALAHDCSELCPLSAIPRVAAPNPALRDFVCPLPGLVRGWSGARQGRARNAPRTDGRLHGRTEDATDGRKRRGARPHPKPAPKSLRDVWTLGGGKHRAIFRWRPPVRAEAGAVTRLTSRFSRLSHAPPAVLARKGRSANPSRDVTCSQIVTVR